jgi:1,2-phenylacetyl-CoA epoxidase catalytic subunit
VSEATLEHDDEAERGLVNLLVVLADNKWFLGLHLSEWAVGAPVLESGVACAAIAQGHMGQARVLYPLLEELPSPIQPGPPYPTGERPRRYNVTALDEPFPSWPHVVAALIALDGALNTMLLALQGSAYEQLHRRVTRMLEEERFQREFAEGRVRELVAFSPGRDLLQERIDAVLAEMLCWFGPPGEPGVAALARAGLLDGDGDRWRQSYLDRIAPVLLAAGVALPVRRSGQTWEYDDLPWDRWNPLQRRMTTPASVPTP